MFYQAATMQREVSGAADEMFRRRTGFLGLLGVAFTCAVYLMTLLRPVLEPFLWAVFIVAALHPLVVMFESMLLGAGRLVCGFASFAKRRSRRGKDRGDDTFTWRRPSDQDTDVSSMSDSLAEDFASQEDGVVSSNGSCRTGSDETVCAGCWAGASRGIAVAGALGVVISILVGVATMIFDAAYRLKANFAIYEKGAQNAVDDVKEIFCHIFGTMPPHIMDLIWDNAMSGAKDIVSGVLTGLLSHTGKIIFELLMLALYVMFWLCTPMPLNTRTERIFRRYLLLKGAVCMSYGICVWVMLYSLQVDVAMLFGLMSFFFSFIPEVGAFIAMLLPVPVILFDSRLEAPFLTLLTATCGQLGLKFVFANIIEVVLVEHDATMRMHPVVTLLAVAFFGFIWGPTGMLLSVPLMAYVKVAILSDIVPPAYRDPILIALEGDGRAPEKHMRRLASRRMLAAEKTKPPVTNPGLTYPHRPSGPLAASPE